MDVRCEKCLTEYEFDDAKVSEAGVTVKCTTCGFVFKVRRMVAPLPTPSRRADEFAPESAAIDKAREWKIRQPQGNIFTCRELTTLQKWIVERKVSREDEISLTGEAWKRLGDIPELANFFLVVDQANRAALLEEQMKSGPNGQPTYVSPGRPSGNYQLGPQPSAADPTWASSPPTQRTESFEEDLRAINKRGPGRWIALVVVLALGGGGAFYFLRGPGASPLAVNTPVPPVVAPTQPVVPPPALPTPSATTGAAVSPPVVAPTSGSGSASASSSTGGAAITQASIGTSSTGAGSTAASSSAGASTGSSGTVGTSGTSGSSGASSSTSGTTGKGGTALAAAPRPKTFEGLMAEAAFWEKKDKPQKAFAAYAGALEMDPNSAEAWAGKGQALIDLERYPDAQAAFNHALGISPRFSDAEFGLAETYKYQGNKAAAVKQYKKFIDDHPSDENAPVARNAIGQLSD